MDFSRFDIGIRIYEWGPLGSVPLQRKCFCRLFRLCAIKRVPETDTPFGRQEGVNALQ